MSRASHLAILALLAVAGACTDRGGPAPTAPPNEQVNAATVRPPTPPPGTRHEAASRAAQEHLARRVALALADPAFRAAIKAEFDGSPVIEHKLHFQRWLQSSGRRPLTALARAAHEPEAAVEADARSAPSLEMYLPVPAHRAAWTGGGNILVATAREDHEAPVAFDIRGKRQVLSADTPPATPVIAVVPVETNFDGPRMAQFVGGGDTPAPPPPQTPGLYMTASHFVQDFEGWLKGSPEYEIHVLGQSGTTDSLTSYQCVGEHAGAPYAFDQNSLDWTGNVLVFSQTQLNSYKAAHPNQNLRLLAIEDDDGACQIRLDGDRFKTFQSVLQANYPNLTGGKDSTINTLTRIYKRANALQRILKAAYSWITSQDDLIGNAIEDTVVGEYHAGFNWVVRGENNVTNGWLKLQMR
ncbi:MAG TPA: hypothetical protein VFP28_06300 [Gemmatimonadales bacterium]|nr:hypothetical protein [Gemmatimonadales bacterium]